MLNAGPYCTVKSHGTYNSSVHKKNCTNTISLFFSVGTYKVRGKELIFSLVKTALEAGYRSFGKIMFDALNFTAVPHCLLIFAFGSTLLVAPWLTVHGNSQEVLPK